MNLWDKIKVLFVLNKEIKEIKTMDIKSGWKTTEFWGKVALQAGTIWAAVGSFIPPKYAAIVVLVSEGIYAAIRGALKLTALVQAAKSDPVVQAAPVQ